MMFFLILNIFKHMNNKTILGEDESVLNASASLTNKANVESKMDTFYKNDMHIEKQTDNAQPTETQWRNTLHPLLPKCIPGMKNNKAEYDLYPFRQLGDGKIFSGYDSLATWISGYRAIIIDGYTGNEWKVIREHLSLYFIKKSLNVTWVETTYFEQPQLVINDLIKPFLGEYGDVWGKKTSLVLEDFYRMDELTGWKPDSKSDIAIIIGPGAALCGWDAPVIYIDLPKNELQYRMRAGAAVNLCNSQTDTSVEMYKRSYFIDWVVLGEYRKQIKNKISIVADGQWRNDITWALLPSIREGLQAAAHNLFRVRPWFEAGTWGGQWMKEHIPALPQKEINYAWSFELIVPENGLIFESDGNLLELCFDWLMEQEAGAILGKDAERFGTYFPIRFDFLDTFDGGNLSIQCHPTLPYIQEQFGEVITQDETYYILDCKAGAGVYLGFQEDINSKDFRENLENSLITNTPMEIEKYIQKLPAQKHELFLIPNGTVHSAGKNNLVLEISATPYIFTFKMYDWVRLDLNGLPRPINIEHAFNNLNFERKGNKVIHELISHPVVIDQSDHYQLVHLPTHPAHFYDVHRIEFMDKVTVVTEGKCHILMLVEGSSVLVKTAQGECQRFHYAETFVIPAASESYQLINESDQIAKIIKAFIK
jgi:mannose-6-phosphate isomerase class I